MKFVLMSLLLFIEIKHILVQLVNELIGLVELMLVIQEVVGLRVVHDGWVELNTPSPLVVDEFVHDFGV